MRARKIVAIVVGALLVLVGLALVLPGGFLLWAHGSQRDSSGFYVTPTQTLSTDTYAVVTHKVYLERGPWTWLPGDGGPVVRLQAATMSDAPLFIGIGPAEDVSKYLAGVAHDEVTGMDDWFHAVDYLRVGGDAPSSAPGLQEFWVARAEGSGLLSLEWPAQTGDWIAVLMNADASRRVASSVRIGGRLDVLLPIGVGMSGGGAVLLAIGTVLIVLGARRERVPVPTSSASPPGEGPNGQHAGR